MSSIIQKVLNLLQLIVNLLHSFFQVFSKSIYQLCNDKGSLSYAASSVFHNFYNDGVRYLEIRSIPRPLNDSCRPDQEGRAEEYVTTVLDSIDSFKAAEKEEEMSIYLILAIDRASCAKAGGGGEEEAYNIANHTVDLAIKYRDRGVVGVDLCGNPNAGPGVSLFRDAFAKAKKVGGLGITLHFAETDRPAAAADPVSSAADELAVLLSYGPDRLGHVIHVPDNVKQEIARRRLGLELCLSCNVHAKMIAGGGFIDHHFGYWRQVTDCPLALCVGFESFHVYT